MSTQQNGQARSQAGALQRDPEKCPVRAPYNFVPFPEKGKKVLRYEETLPPHDRLDPALKTGEIHITMTAETPVFVSDGAKDKNGRSDPHFFRTPGGQFALPGSTVRGMTRANMQVLGFGGIRPGEEIGDQRLFFRRIADSSNSLAKGLKEYYTSQLDVRVEKTDKGQRTVPRRVQAGYLCRDGGSERYFIRPAGRYYRVSKAMLEEIGLGSRYAQTLAVAYRPAAGAGLAEIRLPDDPQAQSMQQGMLLCPGVDTSGDGTRSGSKKPSHRYVFPVWERCPADQDLPISPDDALAYAQDFENRRNNLKGGTQIRGQKIEYDPDFWALPKPGQPPRPVFYLEVDGHIYFGMSPFLRLGYAHTLAEGLPGEFREAAEPGRPQDYPQAILGFARQDGSYRSRVFFGDLAAQGSPTEMEPVCRVLGEPKPSWFAGYTKEGKHYNTENSNAEDSQNTAGFALRGQKRYWLREQPVRPAASADRKENVESKLRPLPQGTVFRGVIRYKNLRPHELGLLLWSLRLEQGCFQSVGMGKPYGYGRMSLQIDRLLEYDLNTLYTALDAAPQPAGPDAVEEYIRCYDAFAVQKLAIEAKKPKETPSIRERTEIKDLFFISSKVWPVSPDAPVNYMQLTDYQNLEDLLPEVKEFRAADNRKKKEAARAAQAAPAQPQDPFAQLEARWGKKSRR